MLNFEKIVMMINWFARQNHDKSIDKLDILNLIYLSDRYHLRRFGRSISGDCYFAMDMGPVPSYTKNIFDDPKKLLKNEAEFAYGYLNIQGDSIRSQKPSDKNYFCESESEALNATNLKSLLVKQNQESLPDFTHHFPEWKECEASLMSGVKRKKMNILKFFEELSDGDRALFEYCPAQSRLLASNKQKFIDRQKLEQMIGGIHA